MQKQLYLFILCLVVAISTVNAQKISGKILRNQHQPAQKAWVTVLPSNIATQTNEDGLFTLENIQAGVYQIRVQHLLCQDYQQSFKILEGENLIQISLTDKEIFTDEVVIAGKSDRKRMYEVEGTGIYAGKKSDVVMVQQLNANVGLNNARQIFGKVPGVFVWENDASGQQIGVAVRGLSPNRSWEFNVRQNGYDLSPDAFGYPEAYFNPPMEAVKKIEIVRGAAGLQYGPQFGGLMNYQIKDYLGEKAFQYETQNTVGSTGWINTYHAVGGKKGKVSYFMYANQRMGKGWRENSDFNIRNAHAKVGYAVNPHLALGVELTGMHYVIQQAGGLTDSLFHANSQASYRSRNWFSVPWFMPALTAQYEKNNWKVHAKVFGVYGERNSIGNLSSIQNPDTIQAATLAYSNRQIDRFFFQNQGAEVRAIKSYTLLKTPQHLSFGARLYNSNQRRQLRGKGDTGTNFNLDVEGLYPSDVQYTTQNIAFYAENVWRWKRLAVIPGVRYEGILNKAVGRIGLNADGSERKINVQDSKRGFVLGGIGAEYHVSDDIEAYGNIAQAYRPVLLSDITPAATTDSISATLKDARGWTSEIGIRGNFHSFLYADLNVFYLKYANRIGALTQLNAAGNSYVLRTNIGDSYSRGIEGLIEITPLPAQSSHQLSIYTSFSVMDAQYDNVIVTKATGAAPNISIETTSLKGKKVEYAPNYTQRAGVQYGYKQFSTSVQFSHTGTVFTDANNTEQPNAAGTVGRLPAYSVWDWGCTWKFSNRYTLKGGINNLLNHHYATRRAGGYPGPGIMPADGRVGYLTIGATF